MDPQSAPAAPASVPVPAPLHLGHLTHKQLWDQFGEMTCACKGKHSARLRRCPHCKLRNPLASLAQRHKRLESWLQRTAAKEILPRLKTGHTLFSPLRTYEDALTGIQKRPFPVRLRLEPVDAFTKRVVAYLQSLFQSTAPPRLATELDEATRRSATVIATTARGEATRVLHELFDFWDRSAEEGLPQEAERVRLDLERVVEPYRVALEQVKTAHSRMLVAYSAVRLFLARPSPTGLGGRLSAWWRSRFHSTGRLLRFPTALWKNEKELEELRTLDRELIAFHETIPWIREQGLAMHRRFVVQLQDYRHSLGQYLAHRLVDHLAHLPATARHRKVLSLLAGKELGNWWSRWWYRRALRRLPPAHLVGDEPQP